MNFDCWQPYAELNYIYIPPVRDYEFWLLTTLCRTQLYIYPPSQGLWILTAVLQNTKAEFFSFFFWPPFRTSRTRNQQRSTRVPDPEVCVLCRWDWPAGCVPAGPDAGCAGPGAGGHLSLDRLLQAGQRRGLCLQVPVHLLNLGPKCSQPKFVKI